MGGLAVVLLLAALLLGAPASSPVWAQGQAPAAGQPAVAAAQAPEVTIPPEVLARVAQLSAPDLETRLAALDALRTDPAMARLALLRAIQADPPPAQRWRLDHALVEFGTAEDVPVLVHLLVAPQDDRERGALQGAIQALYDPSEPQADLSLLVQDFTFVQTRPPVAVEERRQGNWLLSAWSFQTLQGEGLPIGLIKKLLPLRNTAFDSQEKLIQAIRQRLRKEEWESFQAPLQAALDQIPARRKVEGLLRIRLVNPLHRPLLVRIGVDAWFGRFQQAPAPALLYLDPDGRGSLDLPVELVGDADGRGVRLDLRVQQENGAFIPTYHRLLIALSS